MTEKELFDHLCAMAERTGRGPQPPFAPVALPLHPDDPIDYGKLREEVMEEALGPADYIFYSSLGAPHIDVSRHPPRVGRPFWCFVTNGMSDFPQLLPDGSTFRSELMCATRESSASAPDLLQVLATFPFRCDTFLHLYHTVPFPEGVENPAFTHVMTIPPFLVPDLAKARFLGERLVLMSIIVITDQERESAVREGSEALVERLPDLLDTWLIDARKP